MKIRISMLLFLCFRFMVSKLVYESLLIKYLFLTGNHDDPSGFGLLSSLDILATSGLVNYFGKRTVLEHLEIYPILMKKGVTQLAIYGLSFLHDSRLVRLFADSKVVMKQPDEGTGEFDFWLFVFYYLFLRKS